MASCLEEILEVNRQIRLILCTCPDQESAKTVANTLVDKRLAACVNIIPQIMSIYRWQDKVEHSNELLLLIKTNKDCVAQIQATICEIHPYELPEIISVPIENGLATYLAWIDENVTP